MKSPEEIKNGLEQFTGTEQYYKYTTGLLLTDGVKYLADACDCYWLLDIIVSYQFNRKIACEPFQTYKLTVNQKRNSAKVTIEDGNENVLKTQIIEYTDFPLDEIKLWCIDKVILLPSEY